MGKLIDALNNRILVAIIVALFLLNFARRFVR